MQKGHQDRPGRKNRHNNPEGKDNRKGTNGPTQRFRRETCQTGPFRMDFDVLIGRSLTFRGRAQRGGRGLILRERRAGRYNRSVYCVGRPGNSSCNPQNSSWGVDNSSGQRIHSSVRLRSFRSESISLKAFQSFEGLVHELSEIAQKIFRNRLDHDPTANIHSCFKRGTKPCDTGDHTEMTLASKGSEEQEVTGSKGQS